MRTTGNEHMYQTKNNIKERIRSCSRWLAKGHSNETVPGTNAETASEKIARFIFITFDNRNFESVYL